MFPPICAPATPLFPAAIHVVRVSGQDLRTRLRPLLNLPEPRRAALRRMSWGDFQEQALVLFFPAPASYTGEDVVEFQLHGNPLLTRRFLEHLGTLGIRLAEPGEFTRRALLHGKQDLLEVEALGDLLSAATDAQLRMAQARAGQVPAWLKAAKATIIPWLARAEGAVDYGEDEGISLDLDALKRDFRPLLQQFHVEQTRSAAARWLRDGITLALVGRPNAGKSTLFNALAGEDRAIVTAHPGTTRDVLEVRCEWAGLPLVLFDTAGLRRANDPVERLGVERVAPVLERVDLVLHLQPASDPKPDEALLAHLEPFRAKVMDVYTFSDVASAEGIAISAATGDLTALEKALKARFLGDQAPEACLGALATQRQRELLDDMVTQVEMLLGLPSGSPAEVVASLLQGLWELWARLTGEDRAESALDHLFTGFCLGK